MGLLYKPDWDETKERYRAWWAHEYFGRCGLWVTAPRDDAPDEPAPKPADDPFEAWHDIDYLVAWNEWNHRRTYYGGEAFPKWTPRFSCHKNLPAYLGCKVSFSRDSAWLDPVWTADTLDYQSLKLDENSPHLLYAVKEQRRAVVEAKGKSIPPICVGLGGSGDSLAGLRGSERLLCDLIDRPDDVRAADQALMDLWCKVYDRFYGMVKEAAEGSTTYFSLWAPGKFYASQNDFAYMISPDQFRDVFLPTVERQVSFLDYSIHHLDGEGNFRHVDALLELPKLGGIQVLPGAGKPSPLHYLPILRKVQAAGKNLHITIPPEEVRGALDELSARGLFIHTHTDDEQQARGLLRSVEKWSRDR